MISVTSLQNGDSGFSRSARAQRVPLLAIAMIVCIGFIVVVPRPPAKGEQAIPSLLFGPFTRVLRDSSEPGLPLNWQAAWSPSARDSTISQTARAIRIGAHLADLDLVAIARKHDATWPAYYGVDTTAVSRGATNAAYVAAFAHEIVASLAATPDGRRGAEAFRRVEQRGRDRATIGIEVENARAALPPEQMTAVALGNWLEGARIAAYSADTAFFREPRCRAMAILAIHTDAARPARHMLQQLRAIVMARDSVNLTAAGRAATTALRRLVES
jgi:hypothetical protein